MCTCLLYTSVRNPDFIVEDDRRESSEESIFCENNTKEKHKTQISFTEYLHFLLSVPVYITAVSYTHLKQYPDLMEITALADINPACVEEAAKEYNVSKERCFTSAEELLAQPKPVSYTHLQQSFIR